MNMCSCWPRDLAIPESRHIAGVFPHWSRMSPGRQRQRSSASKAGTSFALKHEPASVNPLVSDSWGALKDPGGEGGGRGGQLGLSGNQSKWQFIKQLRIISIFHQLVKHLLAFFPQKDALFSYNYC